jgi:hypothetical protein
MDCDPSYDAWLTDFPGNLIINQSGMAKAVEISELELRLHDRSIFCRRIVVGKSPLVNFDAVGVDTSITGASEGTSNLSAFGFGI